MQDLLYNESFPEEWQCYIVARCQRTLDQGKISNRTMSTTIILFPYIWLAKYFSIQYRMVLKNKIK